MILNRIILGDTLEILKTMETESIHCIVTSPPYWGKRDYGIRGQIGLENSIAEYIQKITLIFREAKRVLRSDGTLWINIGDTYAGSWGGQSKNKYKLNPIQNNNKGSRSLQKRTPQSCIKNIKRKNICGIPWRVAFALQNDNWYLRQDIIWSKSNPMPESVKDRCTTSHEYIFLLTKSDKYYFDYKAIREPAVGNDKRVKYAWSRAIEGSIKSDKRKKGNSKTFRGGKYIHENSFHNSGKINRNSHGNMFNETGLRNKRSVWTVATQGCKDAHFATFPEKLITPCILAGCPEGGIVLDPFMGTGRTAKVALKLNRNFQGIELNPEYITISENIIKPYLSSAGDGGVSNA